MKYLKLYEEYTTTTNTTTKFPNLPGSGQPPSSESGQPRIPLRPGYTPPPPTDNNLIEVYFYPDKEQKEEAILWGWINLEEFDERANNRKDKDPNLVFASGHLYFSKEDAKNLKTTYSSCKGSLDLQSKTTKAKGGEQVDGVFWFMDMDDEWKEESSDYFECIYNIKFWNFIRDRYYEKNASGRLVRKISPGGFTDNSSVDTPDKFA